MKAIRTGHVVLGLTASLGAMSLAWLASAATPAGAPQRRPTAS